VDYAWSLWSCRPCCVPNPRVARVRHPCALLHARLQGGSTIAPLERPTSSHLLHVALAGSVGRHRPDAAERSVLALRSLIEMSRPDYQVHRSCSALLRSPLTIRAQAASPSARWTREARLTF
jgi:hypothetical protein